VTLDAAAFARARDAMERPQPRVALGLALRGIASAAIDLSDGLVGDLGHVLRRSGAGALVDADALPRGSALATQPRALQLECTLAGGDDYELLFAAPPAREADVRRAARECGVAVTPIGRIEPQPGLRVVDAGGRALDAAFEGFDHFRA
jgi:thiamine-monophosphate kinase